MFRGQTSLFTRSVRFGIAATATAFATALTLCVGAYVLITSDAEAIAASTASTTEVTSTAPAVNPGITVTEAPSERYRSSGQGPSDELAIEPALLEHGETSIRAALDATTEPLPLDAPVMAAAPSAPSPAPVAGETPEPRVVASRAHLYTVIAAAFPEQPDKAYGVVMCESSGNVGTNTGNGYYGLWQFDQETWRSVGGAGLPSDASMEEQVMRARMLYERRGWAPWGCA